MLEFDDNFFKPEIRDGFFVDATMKTLWAAELEVLNTVAEICARNRESACGGRRILENRERSCESACGGRGYRRAKGSICR